MLFSLHCNTSLFLQALFHPFLLKTAMTRIVHGIRMMKGIMLTSSLHQTISFIEISIEAGILLGGKHKACFELGVAGIEPKPS